MPKNTTLQLCSLHMLAKCSKSFKLGFSSTWTENFQMYKLGFKEAEETEIKLPTFIGSWRKQGSSRKTSTASLTKAFDCVKVTHSCPTLYDPMDYTVHGILKSRILEWIAILFSRGSSWLRDWTQVSCIAGRFSTAWATKKAHKHRLKIRKPRWQSGLI